jgi:hypothetical protein
MPTNEDPKRRPASHMPAARRNETVGGTARHEALERRADRAPKPSQRSGGAGTFGTSGLKERGGNFFETGTGLQGHVIREREPSRLPAERRGKDENARFYVPQAKAGRDYRSPTRSSAAKAKPDPEMVALMDSLDAGFGPKKKIPVPSTPEATD